MQSAFGNVLLASVLNSNANDTKPYLRADGKELCIASDRAGGKGGYDLWSSTANGGTLSPPTNVAELNTTEVEVAPVLSADGLTLYFASNRAGGLGDQDIWVTTRATLGDKWKTPTNVGELNSSTLEQPNSLSPDECTIYLVSARPGGSGLADIWFATRK